MGINYTLIMAFLPLSGSLYNQLATLTQLFSKHSSPHCSQEHRFLHLPTHKWVQHHLSKRNRKSVAEYLKLANTPDEMIIPQEDAIINNPYLKSNNTSSGLPCWKTSYMLPLKLKRVSYVLVNSSKCNHLTFVSSLKL